MWWHDLLWGLWNGLTAWIVLIVHVFGGLDGMKLYDDARQGNWYDLGFLFGTGSPFLGTLGSRNKSSSGEAPNPLQAILGSPDAVLPRSDVNVRRNSDAPHHRLPFMRQE